MHAQPKHTSDTRVIRSTFGLLLSVVFVSLLSENYPRIFIDLLAGVPDGAAERGGGELLWAGQGGGHAHSIYCSGNQI